MEVQLRPSKGAIRVFGQNVWNNPRVLSQIGYCPESDPFWSNLTGRQFVVFLARTSGMSGSTLKDAVEESIRLTGMTEHAGRTISEYSKGMRQRIKIAQALVHGPKLLILDEPFTGADPIGRHDIGNLFRALAEQGVDILISSHILHEVEALTKQILMINHGRIVAQGDIQTVRRALHNRPHAIRVRIDRPRRLAAQLAELDVVTGLTIAPPDGLTIETHSPEQVYERLTGLILDEDMKVREIAAADENLEAVFGYLTQRTG